jgi:hypothetical protein
MMGTSQILRVQLLVHRFLSYPHFEKAQNPSIVRSVNVVSKCMYQPNSVAVSMNEDQVAEIFYYNCKKTKSTK